MIESLDVLLADHRPNHSTLQCRRFITARAGRTVYGQYKQALRELEGRTWTATDELLELADVAAQAEEHGCDEHGQQLSPARGRVRDARLRVKQVQLERQVRDRLREWAEFYAQACYLRGRLGLAPGKQLDDAARDRYEADFWVQDFAARAAARLEAGERPITSAEAELVATLPEEDRENLLLAFSDPDRFQDWYRARGGLAAIPAPGAIPSIVEAHALLVARLDSLGLAAAVEVPQLV